MKEVAVITTDQTVESDPLWHLHTCFDHMCLELDLRTLKEAAVFNEDPSFRLAAINELMRRLRA